MRIVDDRVEHLGFDLRRCHAGQFEHVAGLGRQGGRTRQHRLAHRRRQGLRVGGEQLGDEERVAVRQAVQAAGAAAGASRQFGDGAARKRCQRHAGAGPRGQAAEHAEQRVVAAESLVAVAEHEQRARALDAPADIAQQIERGAIGPLHIVDHEHGRRAAIAQHREHAGEHLGGVAPAAHRRGQRRWNVFEQIDQRTQRRRRKHRLAGAAKPLDIAAGAPREFGDEAGLAAPRLGAQQHATPGHRGAPQRGDALAQQRQLGAAFEQWGVDARQNAGDRGGRVGDSHFGMNHTLGYRCHPGT